jgi:hypothetical protein
VAYTEEQLRARIETLESGLLQIAKGVTFADRGVQYNSAAELIERIDYFKRLLAELAPTRSKQTYLSAAKGF